MLHCSPRLLQACREGSGLPQLLIIVTGKGPQKTMYEERMRMLDLRHVAFRTAWLEPEYYPKLLGSADLGICLHTSSSGLDLPMKVGPTMPAASATRMHISERLASMRQDLVHQRPVQ